ncbi:hypothetical protein LTR67_005296 [Exophiala xenobiotica]
MPPATSTRSKNAKKRAAGAVSPDSKTEDVNNTLNKKPPSKRAREAKKGENDTVDADLKTPSLATYDFSEDDESADFDPADLLSSADEDETDQELESDNGKGQIFQAGNLDLGTEIKELAEEVAEAAEAVNTAAKRPDDHKDFDDVDDSGDDTGREDGPGKYCVSDAEAKALEKDNAEVAEVEILGDDKWDDQGVRHWGIFEGIIQKWEGRARAIRDHELSTGEIYPEGEEDWSTQELPEKYIPCSRGTFDRKGTPLTREELAAIKSSSEPCPCIYCRKEARTQAEERSARYERYRAAGECAGQVETEGVENEAGADVAESAGGSEVPEVAEDAEVAVVRAAKDMVQNAQIRKDMTEIHERTRLALKAEQQSTKDSSKLLMHAADTELKLEQTLEELREVQHKAQFMQKIVGDQDVFIRTQLKKEKARTLFLRCANTGFEWPEILRDSERLSNEFSLPLEEDFNEIIRECGGEPEDVMETIETRCGP